MSQPLKLYTYDLETLVNFFSFTGKFYGDPKLYVFEISTRRNQRSELLAHLSYLQNSGTTMVGFNNLGFDYPILHELLNNIYTFTYETAYNLCQQIIGGQQYGNSGFNISLQHRIIPQVDLVKINHLDNQNKRTPLKSLQFAMRLPSVEDIPVKIGEHLTHTQMDETLKYNAHDVTSTEEFLNRCMKHLMIRKELLDTGALSGDVLNFSDVKLGTEYLIKKIGRAKCFQGSKPRQTFRPSIAYKDIILPKIFYRTEPFNEVLEWFKKQIIYTDSEKELPKLKAHLAGLDFHFGVGGVHSSVNNKFYSSSETHVVKDIDVSGMYPAIAIANGFAPEHLGKEFTDAYKQLQIDRKQYKKGTTMNLILKLAGNGVFGNSDNVFSCFYDPKFPKEITINGQLQLLQLVETLSLIPDLHIIQTNTDGISCYVSRKSLYLFELWKSVWEQDTGLKLEEVEYSKMWIRDCNNYLAVDSRGAIKAKGVYWYPKNDEDYWGGSGSMWHRDFSNMIVPKVTEQVLINDWNPEYLVKVMTDPFDFMIRYKTPKDAVVLIGEKETPKTVRYYVSTKGEPIKKVSKPKGTLGTYKRKNGLTDEEFNKISTLVPLGTYDQRIHTKNKSRYETVTTNIESGRLVRECNDASKFNWSDVDYDYYIKEIEKLYIGR